MTSAVVPRPVTIAAVVTTTDPNPPAASGFDYQQFSTSDKKALQVGRAGHRREAPGRGRAAAPGHHRDRHGALLKARRLVAKHGNFTTWVEHEVGLELRTAQNFMNYARFAADYGNETVSSLQLGTVYKLAAARKKVPEVVDQVVADLKVGNVRHDAEIKTIIRMERRKVEERERRKHQVGARRAEKEDRGAAALVERRFAGAYGLLIGFSRLDELAVPPLDAAARTRMDKEIADTLAALRRFRKRVSEAPWKGAPGGADVAAPDQ